MSRKPTKRVIGALTIQTAPQAAAEALREAIISGELQGGDRILEQQWSQRLGIGQPTLREALLELEHQGLLKRLPQRGTYITKLGADDYQRILEVRIPLEASAIGKAAARLTPEAEKELTSLLKTMAADDNRDIASFHKCDVLFHRTIWDLADNPYLSETLEAVTFRLFVFSIVGRWPDTPNATSERKAAIQQHVSILQGIRTRNPIEAKRTFVKSTIKYWNKYYGLKLREETLIDL